MSIARTRRGGSPTSSTPCCSPEASRLAGTCSLASWTMTRRSAGCGSARALLTTRNAFWVWEVVVDEQHRGRGLGRAAMLLAEEQARAAGAVELGLNVFGYNTVARALYESLAYETVSMQMRKQLSAQA